MAKGSLLYITLGCAKNEVDTDRMRALLDAADYQEVDSAQDADAVVINTCSFLASATSESIETTLALAEEVKEGVRAARIIMCGCVPSRYGDQLPQELPEVSAFVRADEEDGIVAVVDEVLGVERDMPSFIPNIKRTVEGSVAYVKISDGCDRFCSFCAIPYIRGRYHSRPADRIIAEARELVAGGVKEIVLIGQDTGIWGKDFKDQVDGPANLAQLLVALAEELRPQHVWIRVLYLQPEGMTGELIAAIRDTPEVLPYIDIPVQHCNERVLKSMHRSGSEQQLDELFARLRSEIPGMVIRTTSLVGFPGETDEEAEQMLAFMDRNSFDYTSVFAYSREEGTRAAEMDDQVDEDVKLERAQKALDLAEALGFAATASHVGETAEVIIDGIEENDGFSEFIGHAWFQAPDSDGAVHLDIEEACIGDIVTVEFTDSFCYELVGHVIESE
ncbi:30S ribosomal protein S12 methylthiotransferase RimO [Collinsella tanakaei]|jgi:ribosomal protein S12 methylthiotransferase|uniref:Ribosomal protein uS12 methylthiotransferase RimO n=1 Tax=Collinsella tanakaei TaxID=626935 RepID=A0A3E4QPW9_9ACTN|nr:30S ribosomal protein S12 methylthiotransferase RimO [Collinsella tanakaei]RGL08261.1 30S ribosomal protein S12 methylthiotransferase RimO [Collinsella tanakaei]